MTGEAGARRGVRFHLAALAMAMLLAAAETWPLVTVLASHYPRQSDSVTGEARTSASSDQLLTSWILASNVKRLGEEPLAVFDTNNMTPFRRTLAFSESLLGMTFGIWPAQIVSDNPVLADNLALLFTLTLSAYGVMLLVHELTGSRLGALTGAVFATYAPYVWVNIDQLHIVAGGSAALAWFALARLVRTHRWRWAVLLAGFTAWQVWATLHWGLFLALGLASGVSVLLLLSADARRVLPQLVVAAVLTGLLIVPLALPYAAVGRGMGLRDPTFIAFLFFPWIVLPPFQQPLAYFTNLLNHGVRQTASMTMAPFVAMIVGLVASLVIRRPGRIPGSMMAALATAGVVNFWYACGPQEWFGIPSLYTALADVPGLGIVRAPTRALFYTDLMVAVLGGCGVGAISRRVGSRLVRGVTVIGLLVMAVVEAGWKPGGIVAAPPRDPALGAALASLPEGCAIAELPDDFVRQGLALFRSTTHWRPLVNGRSGFYPISPFVEVGFVNQFPAPPAVAYLRAAGACAVIVHPDTPAGRAILKNSGAQGLPTRAISATEYLVMVPDAPAPPPEASVLARRGWRIVEPADAEAVLDGSLDTIAEFPVANADPLQRLVVDLGKPLTVSGVDLELGSHFRHYMWTYRLEGSADGTTWSTLTESAAALPPLESYRADEHAVVQRIRFAPTEARFLRLGPLRPPPTGYVLAMDAGFTRWGVAELRVLGVPDFAPQPPC